MPYAVGDGDRRQPPGAADDRLGSSGRAGGEQQQEQRRGIVCLRNLRQRVPLGAHVVQVARSVGDQDASWIDTEVELIDENHAAAVGHQQIAVGVSDIGRQLRAAPRRVHPDDRSTGQCSRSDPEHVLGGVLQEHTDVERPVRTAELQQEMTAPSALLDELLPAPHRVLEQKTGLHFLGPRAKQGRHCRGGHAGNTHSRRVRRGRRRTGCGRRRASGLHVVHGRPGLSVLTRPPPSRASRAGSRRSSARAIASQKPMKPSPWERPSRCWASAGSGRPPPAHSMR